MVPSRYYARVFALGTFVALAWLTRLILQPFVIPIIWAALLAFMLAPLHRKLLAKRGPNVAAGVMTLATFLTVAGPVSVFGFALVRQAGELLRRFQSEAAARNLPALQLVLEFKPVQLLLDKAEQVAALSKEQILSAAAEAAQEALQKVASMSGTVLVGTLGVVSQFGLTMFLLFFFLRDGRQMVEKGIALVPMMPGRKESLMETLGGVTQAVVLGTFVTSLVQGTLVGIGFAIAGLPSPLVFGALGALASLIPIVGTALVWIPASLTLLAQGQTGWAIFLVLWSVVLVAGSDNVVRPLIISGRSNASTLLVFVGLLGGVGVFGFAGIFMGPLVLTLVATLLDYAGQEFPRQVLPAPSPPDTPEPPPEEPPPAEVPSAETPSESAQ